MGWLLQILILSNFTGIKLFKLFFALLSNDEEISS